VNDDVFKFGKARDTFSTTDWSEAPNDSNSTPSDDENQENLTAPTSIETSKSQASDLKTKTVQGSVFDVVDDYHVKDDDNKEVVDAAVARLTRSSGSLSNSLRHCTWKCQQFKEDFVSVCNLLKNRTPTMLLVWTSILKSMRKTRKGHTSK